MTTTTSGRGLASVALPFVIVTLIWGSTWMVIRGQLGIVDPSWSISYRFAIAGAAMFAYGAATGTSLWIGWPGIVFCAVMSLAQFVLNYGFIYRAESFVTSGLVAMISTLLFIPNAVFGRIFLGLRVSAQFMLGSLVAMVGMLMLFWHEASQAMGGGRSVIVGIGFTVAAMICASTANVMQASARARTMPPIAMLGWAMLIGSAINAIFALVTVGPPTIDPHWAYLGGILYLGLFGSAVTFPLYYHVIRTLGPARAAYSVVLVPVIAMLLSTLFEGYRWTAISVGGAVLAVIGLIVALGGRKAA